MKIPRSALILLAAGLSPLFGAASTYQIDPSHSSISFSARTLFTPIHGSFLIGEGTLTFDPQNVASSRVEASIPVSSVDTRDRNRDTSITTKEGWFAVEKHPLARFVSKRWQKMGESYRITGDLTLNGFTHEVVLDATLLGSGPGLQPGSQVIGWEAKTTLDRTRFGVTSDPLIISREIPVTVSIQGVLQGSAK